MEIIKEPISIENVKSMAEKMFGNLVKAVVDEEKGIIAINGELHGDLEALLLEKGSVQKNLWGINLYPDIVGESWIEFDSMINLRPSLGNRSRGVENPELQKRIIQIVNTLIKR